MIIGVFDGLVFGAEHGEDVRLLIFRGQVGGEKECGGMPEDVGDGGDARWRLNTLLLHQFRRELRQKPVFAPHHDLLACDK